MTLELTQIYNKIRYSVRVTTYLILITLMILIYFYALLKIYTFNQTQILLFGLYNYLMIYFFKGGLDFEE
ncbi:MAG: hypothetical protein ACOC1X_01405 [Promethearchaeota archaeon]